MDRVINRTGRFLNRFRNDTVENVNKNEGEEDLPQIVPCEDITATSPHSNEYTELSIVDCKDFSAVVQVFDTPTVKTELERLDTVLLLKIEVDEPCDKLKARDLLQLSNKCKNKAIVIQFSRKNDENFAIHWKSKNLQKFLSFLANDEAPFKNEKIFYKFLADFFSKSLLSGRLGLHSFINADNGGLNIQIGHLADSRGLNLLLIAVEVGKNEVVESLLNQNLNKEIKCNESGKIISAADLAWINRHCDVLLTLLHADSTYPEDVVISECSDKLKKFIVLTEELHAAIKDRNEGKIQIILNTNPGPCHFFDKLNTSAPKLALDLKFIDIYELLLKNKIFLGYHETSNDLWAVFNETERETLREIHFKYSINVPEKHLISLSTNSSISHDDPQAAQKLEHVRYAFGILNNNPFIRIILMIVAASKIFNIIFDFNRQSVYVVDPTADSWTRGLFYITGRIYIGAFELLQRSTEHEAFGTLAHELCHCAMNLVYENRAKPYLSSDKEARMEFKKISKICRQNSHKEGIIHHVYESYSKRMQHAELIVRVPHLLAMYHDNPEKLSKARENFSELFEFYENRVVPDMEKALPKIEAENQIEKKARKILKYKIILVFVGIVSVIGLIGSILIVRSIFYKPVLRFNELSTDDQVHIQHTPIIYKNVSIEFRDIFPENSTAYTTLRSDHIYQMLEGKPLNFSDPYLHYLDELVVHNWKNLAKQLKQKVLISNFTFQNESLRFEELNQINSEAFELLTSQQIKYILDGFELKIGTMIANHTKFFVDRKILDTEICQIFYAFLSNVTDGKAHEAIHKNFTTDLKFRNFYRDYVQQNYSLYSKSIQKITRSSKYWFNLRFMTNGWCPPYKIIYNDTTITSDSLLLNFDQVIETAEDIKMFILSSEAGNGKTATFEQLTMKIKRKFPMRWVSYIDLKDYTQFYNKNEKLENVEHFLCEILNLNSKNEFEKEIFLKFFTSDQVILLWNGYDEIAPDYNDFILKVLKTIQNNTKNIQFICTRLLYEQQLKEKLFVSVFRLFSFDNDDRTEFLKRFFISQKGNENEMSDFIQKVPKIIEILHSSSGQDLNKFKTPLMILIIADLVLNDAEINKNENIYQIYEKFAEKKIEIWQEKGEYASVLQRNEISGGKKLNIKEIFQRYAIESSTFLTLRKKVKKLSIFRQKIPKELTYAEISRMGILYINDEKNFEFAHKTFEEFFIVQYFVENIYDVDDVSQEEAELRIFLFLEEIVVRDNIMAIKFLNQFLQTQAANESELFSRTIVDILTTKGKNVFFSSLFPKNSNLFQLFVDFFKKDRKLLADLLHIDKDETIYTAAHNYVYFSLQNHLFIDYEVFIPAVMKNISKFHLTSEEYEKFIHGRNQKGIILYSLYLFRKLGHDIDYEGFSLDPQMLESENVSSVLESISSNLTKSEIIELFLSDNSPIYSNKNPFFDGEYFMDTVKKFLTEDECQKFLKNNIEKLAVMQYRYYFDDTTLSIETFDFLIDQAKTFISETEICDFISEKNLLHPAAFFKRFEVFWDFCVNYTNKNQQRELLLRKVGWTFEMTHNQQHGVLPINFPPLEIFYWNMMAEPFIKDTFITNLYQTYFNKKEMQYLLLNLSHWEPIDKYLNSGGYGFTDFLELLNEILEGNLTLINQFFNLDLKPENKNILNYLNDEGIYYNELNKINEMFNISLSN